MIREYMAFNDNLANRIRKQLNRHKTLAEKKMFGGLCFLLNGNMCCGIIGNELIIRSTPEEAETLLAKNHTRIFDFSGRPMKGWIYVEASGMKSVRDLEHWLQISLNYVKTLPAK
jgi:TfoX/Sxy family transcriptional regulator of competence genes